MTPKTRSPRATAGLRSVRRAIATAPWRISERLLRSIQPYHPPEIACGNWASNPRMAPSGGLDNRCVLMPAHSGLRCLLMMLWTAPPPARECHECVGCYLRSLFVAGALAVLRYAKIHGTKRRPWLTALLARRPTKVAAIALASKIARMVWAMMVRGERYKQPVALSA